MTDSAQSTLSLFPLHPEVLGWIGSLAKPSILRETKPPIIPEAQDFLSFDRHDSGVQRGENNISVTRKSLPYILVPSWVGSSVTPHCLCVVIPALQNYSSLCHSANPAAPD